jgi:hypothetical protein
MSDRGQDGGGSAKYVAAIRSSRDKGAGEVDRPAPVLGGWHRPKRESIETGALLSPYTRARART